MWPTFRPGDMLLLTSVQPNCIRPGDVISFHRWIQENNSFLLVVHRVQEQAADGFITRGDNNTACDPQPVSGRELVGRVAFVVEDGRRRPVPGGIAGQLQVTGQRLWRRIGPFVGWPYRALRASGAVRKLWRPHITRVEVSTGKGTLVKYVHHNRTVARWWPEAERFWCRKPYDLVLAPPQDCSSKKHKGLHAGRQAVDGL